MKTMPGVVAELKNRGVKLKVVLSVVGVINCSVAFIMVRIWKPLLLKIIACYRLLLIVTDFY